LAVGCRHTVDAHCVAHSRAQLTCAPACVCAYHSASASVSLPSASVSFTSTVLPDAAVWMSLGFVARPLTMFSHAAVMK
jgi:hypothetical protein